VFYIGPIVKSDHQQNITKQRFANTYTRTLYYISLSVIDAYFSLESLNQSPVLIKVKVTPYNAMTDTDVE